MEDGDDSTLGELFAEVEPEDLQKFCLVPEFMGRVPVIATLGDLEGGGPDLCFSRA